MSRKKKHRSQNKKRIWPIWIIALGVVIVAAVMVLSFWKPPSDNSTGPKLVTVLGETSDIKRVTLKDAKTAYDMGTAVFVDVRSAGSYQAAHITGALSIPLTELDSRVDELEPSDWIIPYCT